MSPLNKKLKHKTGFTLVELIVVISILAILGTIAFLSFGGFSSKARDGSRISDTTSLSKGLEIYNANSGKYPAPEQITGTGIIGTTPVAYLGTIQNQISSLTKISKTPKDPLSDNYYIYGTTKDLKQYQIATTLENTLSLNLPLPLGEGWGEGNKVYADSPIYQARVLGNYKGLIKFSSGTTQTWIANIPSLIYNSGTNLLDINTYYSTNKNTNLPYKIKDAVINNKTADILLKEIVNLSATLTGVNITNLTQTGIIEIFTGELLASFGGDLTVLSKVILGTSATTTQEEETLTNFCNTTQPTCSPTGCTLTIGTPTAVNQSWVKGTSNCGFTCNANYSGDNCEIYTDPNTISQTICQNAGWYWVNDTIDTIGSGFCISPRVTGGTEYISWMDIGTVYNWTRTGAILLTASSANNSYGVTYNLGSYTCKSLQTAIGGITKSDNLDSTNTTDDTLENRMRYLKKYKTDSSKLDNIDWVTVPLKPATLTIPAIMISDCIDGVRNLATGNTYNGVTYEQYSAPTNDAAGRINMNNYLLGWSKSSGSHLPSAYSDISSELINNLTTNKGEYQIACEASLLIDSDNLTSRTQLSSVGNQLGAYWGMYNRMVGSNGCGNQLYNGSGYRSSGVLARFVVR